jgi:hypothetical protein
MLAAIERRMGPVARGAKRDTSITCMPPPKKVTTFRIDDDLLAAMRELQERDGILPSEQIRRALRPWLESKGVMKAERKWPVSRKRS